MLNHPLQRQLANFKAHHLYRERVVNEVKNSKNINFYSNDYLGLSQHPKVKKAFSKSASLLGLGSGASAMVSGYQKSHQALEEAFAAFLKRDRAILFNSGYHANLGILQTLTDRNSVIIADKYCHASLIDGAQLSRAKLLRYPHLDTLHAEELLKKNSHRELALVSESIFSIHGDIANAMQLSMLAKKYRALLIIDDAHGIGILGHQGAGICSQHDLSQNDIHCLVTPLGKALGSMGAIVSGSDELIDALLQLARPYRYSTALPPAICDATLAGLKVLQQEPWRRHSLQANIKFFIHSAKMRELPLLSIDETPIKSIVIGHHQKTILIKDQLKQAGFLVSCIRAPTVPMNAACLRICLNYLHQEKDISQLLDQITELIK